MKQLTLSRRVVGCLKGVGGSVWRVNGKNCLDQEAFLVRRNFSLNSWLCSSNCKLENYNLCLLGDHEHGKTCLASAITLHQSKKNLAVYKDMVDIDNSVDEIDRGHSINSSKMVVNTEKRKYVLTDCPGLAKYYRNTIFSSCAADGALIVVSGCEGPTKVTRSHLIIAKYQGIENIVGFISKSDAADKESLSIVELATKEMLEEEGFNVNNVDFIHGSAKNYLSEPEENQQPLNYLIKALDNLPQVERDYNAPALMFVEKIYQPGTRAVGVTGVVLRGTFKKGDKIDIVGHDKEIRTSVASIESFGSVINEAKAGESVEILLKSVKKTELTRGMAVIPKDYQHNLVDRVEVLLKMLPNHDEDRFILFNKEKHRVYCQTGDFFCNIFLKDRDFTISGESVIAELRLVKSLLVEDGHRILFRQDNRLFAIAEIVKILPQMTIQQRKELVKPITNAQNEEFIAFKKKIYDEYGIKTYS